MKLGQTKRGYALAKAVQNCIVVDLEVGNELAPQIPDASGYLTCSGTWLLAFLYYHYICVSISICADLFYVNKLWLKLL